MKIGIIGAGNMGHLHARLIQENAALKLVGIADKDLSRAEAFGKTFGCPAFASPEALFASGIEMVFITVPNTKHAELACLALSHGCHVMVEKPLATTLADAQKVMDAKKAAGKRVFIGLNRRFAPVYVAAHHTIHQAGFKPVNINIIQNDGDMQNPPWLTDLSLTGGFMYDTTVHFLDMAQFLMGDIVEITALGSAAFYPITDGFAILMKFKEGRFGVISSCGYASWASPFERVQVVGDHKTVITEELDAYRYSPGLGAVITAEDYSKLSHEDKWGYRAMHQHLFDALAHNKPALNDLEEGYKVVALIEACTQSAEQGGKPISLSHF